MMIENKSDIIAAVATLAGRAALEILRVSGPGSVILAGGMIPALRGIGPEDSRRLIHDFALDSDGRPIDEVTAIPYFAPKSYTAEEMVEIICHGGFVAGRALLDRLPSRGAAVHAA